MSGLGGMFIQRVQKQHSSTVVVIPKLVRLAMDIKAGDYVIFTCQPDSNAVELTKFQKEVPKNVKSQSRKTKEPESGGS